MVRIAVITEKPKIFHLISKELKELGIPYYSLLPQGKIPKDVTIILTSTEELEKIPKNISAHIIATSANINDIKKAILKLKVLLSESGRKGQIVIGIDPGDVYGVVVTFRGKVIDTGLFHSPHEVIKYIKLVQNALLQFSDRELIIRIGNGSPLHQRWLFRYLKNIRLRAHYEIVDETYTTMTRTKFRKRDITAAMLISKKRGRTVNIDHINISLKPGEIKYIQAKSRILSNGRITISWDLAEKVAKGELSLEKAVKIMENHVKTWR
ncbi:MAG: hypothetical protein ACTSV7_02015 [Candidatus Baldrarchaeia archaeon]